MAAQKEIQVGDRINLKVLRSNGAIFPVFARIYLISEDNISAAVDEDAYGNSFNPPLDLDLAPDRISVSGKGIRYHGEVSGAVFVPGR